MGSAGTKFTGSRKTSGKNITTKSKNPTIQKIPTKSFNK